jgi:hypothetical protein
MMKKWLWAGGLMTLSLLALLVIGLALPVTAGPPPQAGDILPTPTPHPVDEEIPYELTVVGGRQETLTFPGQEFDGVTIGETSATSHYPRGVEFTVDVTSEDEEFEIRSLTLFIRFDHGSGTRAAAEVDPAREVWVAHPWQTGEGQPAWTHFNFYWSLVDADGNGYETASYEMDYSDPNREWFRVETDLVIVYWHDYGEDDPDAIARDIAQAVAATEERRRIGFGGPLSYKPIGVIYINMDTLSEMYGSGQTGTFLGFTSNELGMTVQQAGPRSDEWFERRAECDWITPRGERTQEWRMNDIIFGTIPHEITHLYQYDKGVSRGPTWWTEGQAEWFTYAPGTYDERLFNLAQLDPELPRLEGYNIGYRAPEADSCYRLAYTVGPSFINWLLSSYGGVETHGQIIEAMGANTSPFDAVAQVVGKPFLELENEWRVYIGFEQLSLADIDPASALEELVNPVLSPGDTVTLPGFTPVPLNENPGPAQIANAQCFGGTEVTILRGGSLDGTDYYEVDCQGLTGWLTAEALGIIN